MSLLRPKQVGVGGYKASELIDEHPKKIYKEFHAVSESSRQNTALLRIWNFDNFEGVKGRTPEGRFEIVSRMKNQVLQYIKHKNNELYKNCLRALSSLEKDNVTTEYSELYEIPSHHSRFNEFIIKYADNYSEIDRVNIVKLLIAKFADLHKIKVAHRDLRITVYGYPLAKKSHCLTLYPLITSQRRQLEIIVNSFL